jgi:hypothetical protein
MKKSALLAIVVGLVLVAQAGRARFAQAAGQITSPRDRAAVRGLVPVEGSATDPQFQKYEVHFGPEPNPGDQWAPLEGSPFVVPVVQGRLGLWDTTIIPDGVYSLRLRVVRLDGNYDEYFVRGVLVANRQPTETALPTALPSASSEPPELPLGISSIGDAAVKGGGITLALFAGIALIFVFKEILAALVRKITGRGREDAGV